MSRKWPILTAYTKRLDSLITSQNATFAKDLKENYA